MSVTLKLLQTGVAEPLSPSKRPLTLYAMDTASQPTHTSPHSQRPQGDNRLLLADDQKMVDIIQPHHHDVLCGRGVTRNRHPGNQSFRSLVGLNKVSVQI